MKTISQTYKDNIKQLGREIDAYITYSIENVDYELSGEMLNSITPHYEGNILKSVMKQLDIEALQDIPIGTLINCQFGIRVADEEVQDYRENYEYINLGNYIVYSSEKQEDTDSYKIVCYDKMLNSMKDYESFTTYPITIRNYISDLCDYLQIDFADEQTQFVNYDKEIPSELYLDANGESLDYTFRDVLDELAQVTASTICINDDDELEIRYINDTLETIDEESLKDINVNFGEISKPINTITFKRSADSDAISLSNPIDLTDDLKNEIVISDNQILNQDNRADYLNGILTQLYGFSYSINDFNSTGITYFDLCDKYSITITKTDEEGNVIETSTYPCIMFNDEIQITQGLQENIHTDLTSETKTDYNLTTKDDRGKARTNLMVDKVNQRITAEISNIEDIKGIVLGDYQLTNDVVYQSGKDYYIHENEDYVLYLPIIEYTGVRVGNPSELNLFEQVITYSYESTYDTEFDANKTYYEYNEQSETYNEYTGPTTGNPSELDLFERKDIVSYQLTSDTTFLLGKTYYVKHYDYGDTIPSNTIYELVGSIIQQVDSNTQDLQNQINQTNSNVNTLSTQTSSKFEQTTSSFSLQLNTLTNTVNGNQSTVLDKFADITEYLEYKDGVVRLGVSTNPIVLKLKNDRISFEQSGQEVAYLTNNVLYITDAHFLRQLQIGNFAFIPRENGSLGFRKVG